MPAQSRRLEVILSFVKQGDPEALQKAVKMLEESVTKLGAQGQKTSGHVDALGAASGKAKKPIKDLRDQTHNLHEIFEKAGTAAYQFGMGAMWLNVPLTKFLFTAGNLIQGLQFIEKGFHGVITKLPLAAAAMVAGTVVIVAMGAAIMATTKKAMELIDAMRRVGDATGRSMAAAGKTSHQMAGVFGIAEADSLSVQMARMQSSVPDYEKQLQTMRAQGVGGPGHVNENLMQGIGMPFTQIGVPLYEGPRMNKSRPMPDIMLDAAQRLNALDPKRRADQLNKFEAGDSEKISEIMHLLKTKTPDQIKGMGKGLYTPTERDKDNLIEFKLATVELQNVWNSFMAEIGAEFIPLFTELIRLVIDIVKVMRTFSPIIILAARAFSILAQGLIIVAKNFLWVYSGMKNVQLIVQGVTQALSVLWPVLKPFAEALGGLFNKLKDIDIVEWARKAKKGWDDFTGGIGGALLAIKAFVDEQMDKAWKFTVEWVTKGWAAIVQGYEDVKKWAAEKYEATMAWLLKGWDVIKQAYEDVKKWVAEKYDATVIWAMQGLAAVRQAYEDVKKWVAEKYDATVIWAMQGLASIRQAYEDVKKWVGEKYDALVIWAMQGLAAVRQAYEDVKKWVGEKYDALVSWALAGVAEIKQWVADVKAWALAKYEATMAWALSGVAAIRTWIEDVKAWAIAKYEATLAWALTGTATVKQWFDDIKAWARANYDVTVAWLVSGALGVKQWFTDIAALAVAKYNAAVDWVSNGPAAVKQWFTDIAALAAAKYNAAVDWTITGASIVGQWFSDIATWAAAKYNSTMAWAITGASIVGQWFVDIAKDAAAKYEATVKWLIDGAATVEQWYKDIKKWLGETFEALVKLVFSWGLQGSLQEQIDKWNPFNAALNLKPQQTDDTWKNNSDFNVKLGIAPFDKSQAQSRISQDLAGMALKLGIALPSKSALLFSLPEWARPSLNGSFGWDPIMVPPPAFAKGGIVTGPMMGLVGEAGPEAIIPLSSPEGLARLSEGIGGSRGRSGGDFYMPITITGMDFSDVASIERIARKVGDRIMSNVRVASGVGRVT